MTGGQQPRGKYDLWPCAACPPTLPLSCLSLLVHNSKRSKTFPTRSVQGASIWLRVAKGKMHSLSTCIFFIICLFRKWRLRLALVVFVTMNISLGGCYISWHQLYLSVWGMFTLLKQKSQSWGEILVVSYHSIVFFGHQTSEQQNIWSRPPASGSHFNNLVLLFFLKMFYIYVYVFVCIFVCLQTRVRV